VAILLVVGVAASVTAGVSWRSSVSASQLQVIDENAQGIAATLRMALQRDADVMATVRTMIATDPTMTNAQFAQWFTSLDSAQRFPGTFAFAYVEAVTPAQLPAFAAAVTADPPLGLPLTHPFRLSPAGDRPSYCLMRLIAIQVSASTEDSALSLVRAGNGLKAFVNPGTDECAGQQTSLLSSSTRSGQLAVGSFSPELQEIVSSTPGAQQDLKKLFGNLSPIELVLPVMSIASTGSPSHLLGWVGGVLDSHALLASVAGSHPGSAFTLSSVGPDGNEEILSSSGRMASEQDRQTFALNADTTWRLQVGQSPPNPASPLEQGLIVFAACLLVTFLLAFLFRTLMRARSSALTLVEEKTAELQFRALHDSLTGLPNRTLILERTERALARARSAGTGVALFFVDLDGFKDINDTNGHGVGDQVLQELATRFADALGTAGSIGRLGGDEFIVLAEGDAAHRPDDLAERLLAACDEPVEVPSLPGSALPVSASIGIATGLRDTAAELLRDADIALYRAKDSGKRGAVIFSSDMHAAVQRRVALESELRTALADGQFFLEYQPIHDIDTLDVGSVEALVRWDHPERGIVPPAEFIPALESSGLIVDAGLVILEQACRQAAAWHDRGIDLGMSVNLSGRQLEADAIVRSVEEVIEHTGVDPRTLVFEITETALMRDPETVARRLTRLRERGVRVAIDDFGTGYSSLAYLRTFPADILKIDRTFVSATTATPEGDALVHAMIEVGKALGLTTLAEGIEEQAQLDWLRAEGCDVAQGFLFSPPLLAAHLEQYLINHPVAADLSTVGDPRPGR
jgi:diguanylate cyclase (GGDEF)-like protein